MSPKIVANTVEHANSESLVNTVRQGPEVIKLFPCSIQSMNFFLLIYVKMPTIVVILTFMCWKNSIISLSEPDPPPPPPPIFLIFLYSFAFKISCSAELSMNFFMTSVPGFSQSASIYYLSWTGLSTGVYKTPCTYRFVFSRAIEETSLCGLVNAHALDKIRLRECA